MMMNMMMMVMVMVMMMVMVIVRMRMRMRMRTMKKETTMTATSSRPSFALWKDWHLATATSSVDLSMCILIYIDIHPRSAQPRRVAFKKSRECRKWCEGLHGNQFHRAATGLTQWHLSTKLSAVETQSCDMCWFSQVESKLESRAHTHRHAGVNQE